MVTVATYNTNRLERNTQLFIELAGMVMAHFKDEAVRDACQDAIDELGLLLVKLTTFDSLVDGSGQYEVDALAKIDEGVASQYKVDSLRLFVEDFNNYLDTFMMVLAVWEEDATVNEYDLETYFVDASIGAEELATIFDNLCLELGKINRMYGMMKSAELIFNHENLKRWIN